MGLAESQISLPTLEFIGMLFIYVESIQITTVLDQWDNSTVVCAVEGC